MSSLSRIAIALALCAAGCAGTRDAPTTSAPPPTTVSATPAPPPVPPPPPPPAVRVAAPSCGYGGSSTGAALFVDIDSDFDLHHVSVSFAVSTLDDIPVALSRPSSLFVSPVERGTVDYGTQGLATFEGSVTAHAPIRVLAFTGLQEDPAAPSPAPRMTGPMRMHVTVRTDEGSFTATCDTEQRWASS